MKQLHIKISGRVQGVGFRYSTVQLAQKLNLTGWIRNSEDGGVEIMAEGEENNLQELLKWTQTGPPSAQVENVEHALSDATHEFQEFKTIS